MPPSAPHAGSGPAVNGTIASATYERARRDIIAGVLPPGVKLKIREISERYSVSINPLREALNRLSAERLVVLNDRRGFVVTGVSRQELEELTRTRIWLNEIAVRRSLELGTAEWEETLLIAFHRLSRVPRFIEEPVRALNPERDKPHRAFHSALIEACDSHWIRGYCEQLFDQAERYRNLAKLAVIRASERAGKNRRLPEGRIGARARGDTDEHRPIMEAAIARDVELTVTLLTEHVRTTADILLQFLAAEPDYDSKQ